MVSFYFYPDYSGSSVQAFNLSRQLLGLGIEPIIVSANISRAPAQETRAGIPIYRLPVARTPALQLPSFWLALSLFLVRHRRRIDLVHAHGAVPHGIASLVGRALNRRTILKVTMANSDIAFGRQGRLWGRVSRFLVNRFDRYVATTGAIEGECEIAGLDPQRVRRIPNGVDTETFSPLQPEGRASLRRELQLPAGPVATFMGILNKRKNVDGLLRIWERVKRLGTAGHLLIIGPAPGGEGDHYCQVLRAFVRDRGLERSVTFLGERPDAPRLLRASDVFLFPSFQEGMPNAVLEAMASGLPCVVSAGAGSEGVITHGLNGCQCDVSDEDRFGELVADLLCDAGRRTVLGSAARDTVVRGFSLEAVAIRYRDLYREVLGRGRYAAAAHETVGKAERFG